MIRQAQSQDADRITELFLEVHALHIAAFPQIYREISPADAKDLIVSRLAAPNSYFRVADVDNSVVGYISFELKEVPENLFTYARKYIYICDIVVDQAHRKSGIGEALMKSAEGASKGLGVTRIVLDVWNFNKVAQRFFESKGLEVYGRKMFKEV